MGFNLEQVVEQAKRTGIIGALALGTMLFAGNSPQYVNSAFAQQEKQQDAKLRIPFVSAEKKTEMQNTYAKELAITPKTAPTPEKVKEAINMLLKDGAATNPQQDAAMHYTLLSWAYQKAKEFSDIPNAFKSVEALDKIYEDPDFKPWVWKANMLDDVRKKNPKGEQLEALVTAGIDFSAYEVRLGETNTSMYEEAVKTAKVVLGDAKKMNNKPAEEKVLAIQKYATDLAKDSKDSLTLAKFNYFIYGDQSESVLKQFQNDADGNLKKLAGLQLLGLDAAGNFYELFETAYAAANDRSRLPHEKRDLQSKALDFYRRAITKAEGGEKTTYERKGAKIVAELEKSLSGGVGNAGSIDLLALIDTKKDLVQGEFKQNGKSLLTPPTTPHARLQIPYTPPDEYELRVVASCKSGNESFVIGLAKGEKQFEVAIDGFGGTVSGVQLIEGKTTNSNVTTYSGKLFIDNKPKTIICRVQNNNLAVIFEGKQIINWKADYTSVAPVVKLPDAKSLFIGSYNASYQVDSVQLTPLSGQGKRLR